MTKLTLEQKKAKVEELKNNGHTSGPWRVILPSEEEFENCIDVVADVYRHLICYTPRDDLDAGANGELIAIAPELIYWFLEACEEIEVYKKGVSMPGEIKTDAYISELLKKDEENED